MTGKERVKRAIKFQNPDRLPVVMFNKDFEEGDVIICDVVKHFEGPDHTVSEFGFSWERVDRTMGQTSDIMIKDWDEFDSYQFPNARRADRFDEALAAMKTYGEDKYYVASLCLSGFTVMTFLRGFEDTMCDFYEEPEMIEKLADAVFAFEEEVIRQAADKGFSAVGFFDDWGTQDSLLISGKKWREFFKPRYKKQFDLCHSLGMDVYFHCCGYIKEIIPDFIELGVDLLNISQPNLFDIKELGQEFGGKICFICPVSYQTTSISGTREEIFRDVQILKDNLGCFGGGLVGYVEEYSSMGMSDANYQACKDAFFGREL